MEGWVSIKLAFSGDTIRLPFRFPVSHSAIKAAAFSHWREMREDEFYFTYEDDDGDALLLGSDDCALAEALTHHAGCVLKLFVKTARSGELDKKN